MRSIALLLFALASWPAAGSTAPSTATSAAPPAQEQQPSEASADRLRPAGSINSVFEAERLMILVEDEPTALRQARFVQRSFFADRSELLVGSAWRSADLSDCNLLVFGTPNGHDWLQAHADRLPFRYGASSVEIRGPKERRFEGDHLRVIAALESPHDDEQMALLYTAEHAPDLLDINGVFHGPTEYVVADGSQVLSSGGFAWSGQLTLEEQHADLDALVDRLSAIHPAAAEGMPPKLQLALEEARGMLREGLTRFEFWFVASRLTRSFDDAHTGLAPPGDGSELDLPLAATETELVVAADTSLLRRGDRVLRIGELGREELFAGLRMLSSADNDAYRLTMADAWLRHPNVLGLLGAGDDVPISVTVEREGEELELSVSLGSTLSRVANPEWVRWEFHPQASLAVFVLDRCVADEHYRSVLASGFRTVAEQGIERICVDLRENSGGDSSVCDEFLRYLDVESYATYSADVRHSSTSMAQRGYTAEPGLVHYEAPLVRNERHSKELLFRGDLEVLISPRTFSSGTWFATVLSDNELAVTIGEPTGGAPSGYGDLLNFRLPHSGLSGFASYKAWWRPDPDRDPATSLVPDVSVETTAEDIALGRDPVLAFLLDRSSAEGR